MGISGSKSKLRKGGSNRPEGWYNLDNGRWELRTSQKSGEDYILYVIDGETDEGEMAEIALFLGMANKVGEYVRVEDDGSLKSIDEDEDFELPENSAVGKFFGSLSDAGVSDRIMDNIGDEPNGLAGLRVLIHQQVVMDKSTGEPRVKDGYPVTDTVVAEIASGKGSKGSGKAAAAPAKGKGKPAPPDDDDDDDEDEDEDEDEVPARRAPARKGKR